MNYADTGLSFLKANSVEVAPQLIGWRLYHRMGTELVGGMIAETEAYNQSDAASHSYRGETPRTAVMFGPAGRLYVYFTYGMHYCMNIVTGHTGQGEAVLLRTIIADKGIDTIRARRRGQPDKNLTNGPGKLCQALHVTLEDSGKTLNESEFILLPPKGVQPQVTATPRIGITKNTEQLWRFVIAS